MERKTERNIDLFFFKYESYYDENDDYIVRWEIDWIWTLVTIFVLVSIFSRI